MTETENKKIVRTKAIVELDLSNPECPKLIIEGASKAFSQLFPLKNGYAIAHNFTVHNIESLPLINKYLRVK